MIGYSIPGCHEKWTRKWDLMTQSVKHTPNPNFRFPLYPLCVALRRHLYQGNQAVTGDSVSAVQPCQSLILIFGGLTAYYGR